MQQYEKKRLIPVDLLEEYDPDILYKNMVRGIIDEMPIDLLKKIFPLEIRWTQKVSDIERIAKKDQVEWKRLFDELRRLNGYHEYVVQINI